MSFEQGLFRLYISLYQDNSASELKAKLILLIPVLQYFSFLFDDDHYLLDILKNPLIKILSHITSIFRIESIANHFKINYVSDNVTSEVVIFFLLYITLVLLFLWKKIDNLEGKEGMDLLKEGELENEKIMQTFKKSQFFFFAVLKHWNSYLPIFILPISETLLQNISRIIYNGEGIEFLLLILDLIALILFWMHCFFNFFYFNSYSFSRNNNMNRSVDYTIIYQPISVLLSCFFILILKKLAYFYYFAPILNIIIQLTLIRTYSHQHTFFNPKVAVFYLILNFALFFINVLFILGISISYLSERPIFLVLDILLSIRLSISMGKFFFNSFLSNFEEKLLFLDQDLVDLSKAKNDELISRFLYFYSIFYYLDENEKILSIETIASLPVLVIGKLKAHSNRCNNKDCFLGHTLDKTFLFRDIGIRDRQKLEAAFSKAFSTCLIKLNLLNGKPEYLFPILLFLLVTPNKTCKAIYLLNIIFKTKHLLFYQRFLLMDMLWNIAEKIRQHELAQKQLLKTQTSFSLQAFIRIEKKYEYLKENMRLFGMGYREFLKELALEKIQISNIEKSGFHLLHLMDNIVQTFLSYPKNLRFLLEYRDFISLYFSDDSRALRELSKVLAVLRQMESLQESNNNDPNAPTLGSSTSFFTEKSHFLQVSGDDSDFGRIKKAEEGLQRALGYVQNDRGQSNEGEGELEGMRIDELMPRLVGARHEGYMREFVEGGEGKFILRENEVFLKKKEGLVLPVQVTIKLHVDIDSKGLVFVAMLKLLVKKGGVVITDAFGNIDSYGEMVDEVLKPFEEKLRKFSIPIQALIPELIPYFENTTKAICEKKYQDEGTTTRSKYTNLRNNMTGRTLFKGVKKAHDKPEKVLKECDANEQIRKFLSKKIKNEFGDYILNMIIKEDYVGIPPPLDFEFPYPPYKLDEYYKELKKCILLSEDFFSFYRIDLTFQEAMYKDLSLRIFNIRRIKFLNKTDVKESIEKSMPLDGNPKRTLLTMIPKMLKNSGFLKKKREKQNRRYNKVNTEPFIKLNETLTINKAPRRNSEEIDIENEYDIITKQNTSDLLKLNELIPADARPANYKRFSCLGVLFKQNEEKSPKSNSIGKHRKSQHHLVRIRESGKYFADEGRHLYKIQSKENSLAKLSESNPIENEVIIPPSSHNSSLMGNNIDTKSDFLKLLSHFEPPTYFRNTKLLTIFSSFLVLTSFFLYGGLASLFLKDLSQNLFNSNVIDSLKLQVLKLLIYSQNQIVFGEESKYFIEMNKGLTKIKGLNYVDMREISQRKLMISIDEGFKEELSLLSGIDLYIGAIIDKNVEKLEFLAWNGYNLFIDLEAAFDFNNNITNALDHMKINLVIIVLVFSSFVSFLLCILLVNVYFSLKYINSTLKLPCSISIKDYKMLYNTIFDSKYRKSKSIKEESIGGFKLKSSQSLNKKSSRHHVIPLSFPKKILLLFLFYLLLYGALLIVSLNQSKILDDTLLKKLKNGDHFNKLRLKNYEAFSLLNDFKLDFNLTQKGNDDITKLLNDGNNELSIIVNLDGDLIADERKIWRELLHINLCQDLMDVDSTKICEKIGEGVLTKGLYSAYMYLYTVFRSILDGRVNLQSKDINDDILNIFIFIDLASEDFFSQTKQSLAENLESESQINLIMNSIMALGISSILIIYMLILNNELKGRIMISNRILVLIPIALISKSTKIKKFINRVKKNKK